MTSLADLSSRSYKPRLRVLAVDDDFFVRFQIKDFMVSEGFHCDTCSHPEDAMDQLAKSPHNYGLVFMDIEFGGEALGLNAARTIAARRDNGGPSVIGITGVKSLYDYENRAAYGLEDVLAKPLHKWLLINLASAYCG
ncbi:response regulator [uncultured Roseobacter sp.]|uniref:response regulator n=1 Tax=uncultured Roseobacter sp. TaxID=114847 RepID=UPI002609782B|nr:response regulator [uncultured Roseobacter sp.]